jgi:hypothetical protein
MEATRVRVSFAVYNAASPSGRDHSLAVSTITAIIRDLHLITQCVPHVSGILTIVERLDACARIESIQMKLPRKSARIGLSKDVIDEVPKLT